MITLFPPKFDDYQIYIDNKHQNKLSKEQDMVHMYKKANKELKFVTNLTRILLESDKFPTMQTAVSMTVYECSSAKPTHKTRAKRLRAKRPGETTHGRNDPDSLERHKISLILRIRHTYFTAAKRT